MLIEDEIASANRQMWEREVAQGCGYTVPWLELDADLLRQYAAGELAAPPYPLDVMYPADFLRDVSGQAVLCLASGGGQQTAVFGLLGAHVTVVDVTEGQLVGDRTAADHYGYDVQTIRADMRDLSALKANAYDKVYQADSISYVPDVRQVYRQVARVLKPGGYYRVAHAQPAVSYTEWNGRAYTIAKPYAQRVNLRPDGGIEHRHYMDDMFNGLIEAGLRIRQVCEAPYAKQPLTAEPGTWAHETRYVAGSFAIIAQKSVNNEPA